MIEKAVVSIRMPIDNLKSESKQPQIKILHISILEFMLFICDEQTTTALGRHD